MVNEMTNEQRMRARMRAFKQAMRENDAYAQSLMVNGELTPEAAAKARKHWNKLVAPLRAELEGEQA